MEYKKNSFFGLLYGTANYGDPVQTRHTASLVIRKWVHFIWLRVVVGCGNLLYFSIALPYQIITNRQTSVYSVGGGEIGETMSVGD